MLFVSEQQLFLQVAREVENLSTWGHVLQEI